MSKTGIINKFFNATEKAVNNFFDSIISPSTYKGMDFPQEWWYFGDNDKDVLFDYSGRESILKAYHTCPPFAAIIDQKAQSFIKGTTWILNRQGKESQTADAKKLRKIFERPNLIQSWDHFELQVYINTYLWGYTVVLPVKPFGWDMIETKALWAIPGNMVEVVEKDNIYFTKDSKLTDIIERITVVYKDQKVNIPLEDIIIIRDNRPSHTSVILPTPRAKSLSLPINNVIGSFQSRHKIIRQRGPRFLISSNKSDAIGNLPLTSPEKNDILKQFADKYGLMANQSQAIISGANLLVTPVGFDVKQLGLHEEVVGSSVMICLVLGFPPFLAGLTDPTFNNQGTAEKALFQRFIIPDAKSFYSQWNAAFNTIDINIKIDKDYSELDVLQADKFDAAKTRLAANQAHVIPLRMGIMKVNRYLELMGEDTVPGGDVYYPQWVKDNGFDIIPDNIQGYDSPKGEQASSDSGKNGKNGKHSKLLDNFINV